MDGKVVASKKMENTVPLAMPLDETFDIGSKTGSPVNDQDYKCPFTFTGKLNKLTVSVEPPKLTPADEEKLQAAARASQDAGPASSSPDNQKLQPTGRNKKSSE